MKTIKNLYFHLRYYDGWFTKTVSWVWVWIPHNFWSRVLSAKLTFDIYDPQLLGLRYSVGGSKK